MVKQASISNTSSDGTRSQKFTVVLKRKPPKHDKGQWNYSQTHTLITTNSAGKQSVDDAFCMGNIDQFRVSAGATYTVFQNHTAVQQMNPYLTNTGSAFLGSTVTPLTDRFVVKTYTMKTNFASFVDIDQTGWIYYLTPRVHTTTTPLTTWQNSNVQMGAGKTPVVMPITPSVAGAVGATIETYPYETPLRNSSFHKQWKILKVVKIQLAAGSSQIINATFKVNKLFKNDAVSTDLIEGSRYMPGLTIFMMPVWLGQVMLDKTLAIATPTPTFGITKVGYVTINEYTLSSVSGNAGRLNLAIAAANIPTNAAAASLNEINEELGAVDQETINQ